VFFNVTTPKFAAQAIRKAYDIGWRPTHFLNNVSSSVGGVLQPAGLEKSVGLITTLYSKDATDPQWEDDPGMKAWSAWMDNYYPKGNKADGFNIYGYSVAMTLARSTRVPTISTRSSRNSSSDSTARSGSCSVRSSAQDDTWQHRMLVVRRWSVSGIILAAFGRDQIRISKSEIRNKFK
jgi:branched-chain amino acid transport system substrate-binding protein